MLRCGPLRGIRRRSFRDQFDLRGRDGATLKTRPASRFPDQSQFDREYGKGRKVGSNPSPSKGADGVKESKRSGLV